MATQVFADNAKVMSKGQVTIPKDVRNVLGVGADDNSTAVVGLDESALATRRLHMGSTSQRTAGRLKDTQVMRPYADLGRRVPAAAATALSPKRPRRPLSAYIPIVIVFVALAATRSEAP